MLIGIPSTPGYVPKYVSNDRFSCITTITCLILWMPVAEIAVPPGLPLACALAVTVDFPDVVHAASSPAASAIAQAAATGRPAKFRRRMEPTVGSRHGNPL